MNKEKIKETIELMFLSCPKEDQYSSDIIETLNGFYEYLYCLERNPDFPDNIEHEENEYLKQTGTPYYISYMITSHKSKIKRMPDRSKAVFAGIAIRSCSLNVILGIHKLIGPDVSKYVGMQINKT
jgi:hypothetical protein